MIRFEKKTEIGILIIMRRLLDTETSIGINIYEIKQKSIFFKPIKRIFEPIISL